MDTQTIVGILQIVVPIIIGYGGGYYLIFKNKLNAFRKLVDDVDDAATNKDVAEEEFQKIWADFKVMVGK